MQSKSPRDKALLSLARPLEMPKDRLWSWTQLSKGIIWSYPNLKRKMTLRKSHFKIARSKFSHGRYLISYKF